MKKSKRITNEDSDRKQKMIIGILAIVIVILVGVVALNINKDEAKQVSAQQGEELESRDKDDH